MERGIFTLTAVVVEQRANETASRLYDSGASAGNNGDASQRGVGAEIVNEDREVPNPPTYHDRIAVMDVAQKAQRKETQTSVQRGTPA